MLFLSLLLVFSFACEELVQLFASPTAPKNQNLTAICCTRVEPCSLDDAVAIARARNSFSRVMLLRSTIPFFMYASLELFVQSDGLTFENADDTQETPVFRLASPCAGIHVRLIAPDVTFRLLSVTIDSPSVEHVHCATSLISVVVDQGTAPNGTKADVLFSNVRMHDVSAHSFSIVSIQTTSTTQRVDVTLVDVRIENTTLSSDLSGDLTQSHAVFAWKDGRQQATTSQQGHVVFISCIFRNITVETLAPPIYAIVDISDALSAYTRFSQTHFVGNHLTHAYALRIMSHRSDSAFECDRVQFADNTGHIDASQRQRETNVRQTAVVFFENYGERDNHVIPALMLFNQCEFARNRGFFAIVLMTFGTYTESQSRVNFVSTRFDDNLGEATGGVLIQSHFNNKLHVSLTNLTMTRNRGFFGAALSMEVANAQMEVVVVNSTIVDNVGERGGAIRAVAGFDRDAPTGSFLLNATFVGCNVSANTASFMGGAVLIDSQAVKSSGLISSASMIAVTFVHSTLQENTAGSIGGTALAQGRHSRIAFVDSVVRDAVQRDELDDAAIAGARASSSASSTFASSVGVQNEAVLLVNDSYFHLARSAFALALVDATVAYSNRSAAATSNDTSASPCNERDALLSVFHDARIECERGFNWSSSTVTARGGIDRCSLSMFGSCRPCARGLYSLDRSVIRLEAEDDDNETTTTFHCLPCPEGGRCEGGDILPLDGFWSNRYNSPRHLNFYRCPKSFCGGDEADANGCSAGRDGVLCGRCDVDYVVSYTTHGVACVRPDECGSRHFFVFACAVYVVLLFCYLVARYFFVSPTSKQTGWVRVVIFHVNIFSAIYTSAPIASTTAAAAAAADAATPTAHVLQLFADNVLEPALNLMNVRAVIAHLTLCVDELSLSELLLVPFAEPVLVLGVFLVFTTFALCLFPCLRRQRLGATRRADVQDGPSVEKYFTINELSEAYAFDDDADLAAMPLLAPSGELDDVDGRRRKENARQDQALRSSKLVYRVTCVAMTVSDIIYMQLLRASFAALHCVSVDVDNGPSRRLYQFGEQHCPTPLHIPLLVLVVLLGLLPLAFEVARRRARHKHDSAAAVALVDVLQRPYKTGRGAYTAALYLFRLSLLLAVTFVGEATVRSVLLTGLLVLLLVVVLLLRPFVAADVERLHTVSLGLLVLHSLFVHSSSVVVVDPIARIFIAMQPLFLVAFGVCVLVFAVQRMKKKK